MLTEFEEPKEKMWGNGGVMGGVGVRQRFTWIGSSKWPTVGGEQNLGSVGGEQRFQGGNATLPRRKCKRREGNKRRVENIFKNLFWKKRLIRSN